MTRILKAIKKPNLWIWTSVVYVWFLALGKLVATLGPPYVISRIAHTKNSFWISDLREAFLVYAQETAKALGYKYEYVLYCYIVNVVIFIPAIVVSFFVLRKKLWARNAIIFLLVVYLILLVGIGLLTSESKLNVLSLNTIVLVAIVYVLMRKNTKEVFLSGRSI